MSFRLCLFLWIESSSPISHSRRNRPVRDYIPRCQRPQGALDALAPIISHTSERPRQNSQFAAMGHVFRCSSVIETVDKSPTGQKIATRESPQTARAIPPRSSVHVATASRRANPGSVVHRAHDRTQRDVSTDVGLGAPARIPYYVRLPEKTKVSFQDQACMLSRVAHMPSQLNR